MWDIFFSLYGRHGAAEHPAGVFNLIPIPPLDGSKILISLAPQSFVNFFHQIEPYAPIILLMLIITRAFNYILFPLYGLILDLFNAIIRFIPGL